MINTIPHNAYGCSLIEKHKIELPECCPISKNPRPGSNIEISYEPRGKSLEVGSLVKYIHSFKGGTYDEYGQLDIRDIESMLCKITQDCATVLETEVTLHAQLVILPRQGLDVVVIGRCGDK